MQDISASIYSPAASQVLLCRDKLLTWFKQDALPTWWNRGTDHLRGGFHEKLTQTGDLVDEARRTRVTARQIYVFSAAYRLGWEGPALRAVQHGVQFLLERQRKPDGTFASAVTPQGDWVDARFDLYEQAFALFALASAYAVCPQWMHLPQEAQTLYAALESNWKHPLAGFEESQPPSWPLRSNPHMHLFEALLAWEDVAPETEKAGWKRRADDIAHLCLARLIDPHTGALREYFDAHWAPMPDARGRILEPGHQFEWAWLLTRWGLSRQHRAALAAAEQLLLIGETHGIGEHGAAINELWDDFSPKDDQAKLWPQTERIKAWAIASTTAPLGIARDTALTNVGKACAGLLPYLQSTTCGIWRETMAPDGTFSDQDCRASSLYHIVCAIDTLQALPASLLPPSPA